jgi:hypothetical protein
MANLTRAIANKQVAASKCLQKNAIMQAPANYKGDVQL